MTQMKRRSRWCTVLLSLAATAALLAGCGSPPAAGKGDTAPGSNAGATAAAPTPGAASAPTRKAPVALKIWTQFNDQELAALQAIADKWNAQTGNQAKVEPTQGGFQEYAIAAQAGNGPDLFLGMPHDNLGPFWKAGMLAPIPEGLLQWDQFVPQSVETVTYQGKKYGVPLAMEAVALFYNTDQVKEAPKDWNAFLSIAKEKGFMYALDEPYFNFGFIAGYGGYIWKQTGGGLDLNDIGMNNAGAVQGLQLIHDLIYTYKLMPKDVNGEIAKGKFTAGKSAFWLTSSWEINGLRNARVPFAVTTMPTLPNGQPFRPFIGVQTGFVNAESRHQSEAFDFIKFLVTNGLDDFTIKVSHRIPVTRAGLERPDYKSDPVLSAFAASAVNGIAMPNVPEISAMWPTFAQMMAVVAADKLPPKQAADAMVDQLKKALAQVR